MTTATAELKTCVKCGETKTRYQFNREKMNRDGLRGECKECKRERERRNYYRKHYGDAELAPKATRQKGQDREPQRGRCCYNKCRRAVDRRYDPHHLGFCQEHGENAAQLLKLQLT